MSTAPDRRNFLKTGAVVSAAAALPASSYAKILGSNGKLNLAFLGTGGRCQQHIDVALAMKKQGKPVETFAVCDVWDGDQTKGNGKGQGLFPAAKRCDVPVDDKNRCNKDYRVILENADVDAVCIAAPDHWHARMAIDALDKKKHVYCEKPMTKTIAEAQAVVDAYRKSGCVMTVGVQSMADPTWAKANEMITAGRIGKVLQAQTRYYRNSDVGQWRYYSLTKSMNPKTIDWDTFLGYKFDVGGVPLGPKPEEQPFDRAVYGQWRCYWPFGGGMYTDLFVHQTTHIIKAMGVRYPARVVGGGGLYMEYDTRTVPDVAMVVADYNEGCQLFVTATMLNDYAIDECIRGHTGTIVFLNGPGDVMKGFKIINQEAGAKARGPSDGGKGEVQEFLTDTKEIGTDMTYNMWANFLEAVQAKKPEMSYCTPDLGAAAFTTVAMGAQSYRDGKAYFWDAETRKPTEADASWATKWEAKSKARAEPSHVMGWHAGDKGSTLNPPAYQKLAGPWVDGKDPAGE